LPGARANARRIEPVSPELVLVCPELRVHAPYGPYVPRRPQYIEPLGTSSVVRHGGGKVELTLRLPVLGVAIVGALVKTALQATTIVLGFIAVISLLVLLARL
jgi:hypothetical protein